MVLNECSKLMLLIVVFSYLILSPATVAFTINQCNLGHRQPTSKLFQASSKFADNHDDSFQKILGDYTRINDNGFLWDRRKALTTASLAVASTALSPAPAHSFAVAAPTSTTIDNPPSTIGSNINDDYLKCLQDLPPLAPDCGRIFLCRHGQTENNRLRKVQGARVNVPVNDLGRKQGQRIGMALAHALPLPDQIFSSPLIRAQQTAQEACQYLLTDTNSKQQHVQILDSLKTVDFGPVFKGEMLDQKEKSGMIMATDAPIHVRTPSGSDSSNNCVLKVLESLKEVDFGPMAEGQPIAQAKPGMMATYAQWSMGNIDYRPPGGGDSARDVLERAVEAISTLAQAAHQSPDRCVAAFTHSQYLRMLLPLVQGKSLASGAQLTTANGCINVLDVNLRGKMAAIGRRSALVGGWLSKAPKDFHLDVPVTQVVRINEVRHLQGLV